MPTPLKLTPALEDSLVATDFFFAPSDDETCRLPCWQGLRPQVSTRYDVQDTMDRVFHFHQWRDFFNPVPLDEFDASILGTYRDIPGLYTTGYLWRGPGEFLGIAFWLSETTHILVATKVIWQDVPPGRPSIRHIVREMGSPSQVLVSGTGTGKADFAIIDMLMIYPQGVIFQFAWGSEVRFENANNLDTAFANLCFDHRNMVGHAYLMGPLSDDLVELQQNPIIDKTIWSRDMVPIQQAVGLTINEFAAIATRDTDPCLILK